MKAFNLLQSLVHVKSYYNVNLIFLLHDSDQITLQMSYVKLI